MKRIALAVAAVFTIAAPAAAFAQNDRYDANRYDANRYGSDSPRYDSRDWRVDEGHDYRHDNYSSRDWRGRSDDYARVLESRPLYAEGSGRQECWNNHDNRFEEVHGDSHDSALNAGTAVGAVAGGVLGHQVGSGRGNTMATVGGALLGGLIGNRVHNNREDNNGDYDMSRCRVLAKHGSSPAGYDVRYEYHGQEYVARLDHDPGRWLKLGQDVSTDGRPMDAGGNDASPSWRSGG